MSSIDVRGIPYKIKPVKYGDWKKLFQDREDAISSPDPRKHMHLIDKWVTSMTEIPQEVLDDLTLIEVEDLARRLGESQNLPLPQKEKLVEPSSPTVQNP